MTLVSPEEGPLRRVTVAHGRSGIGSGGRVLSIGPEIQKVPIARNWSDWDSQRMDESLHISLEDAELGMQTVWAQELEVALLNAAPETQPHLERDDQLAQDFGATVALLISTHAAVEIARGIANWLSRRSEARLKLKKTRIDGSTTEVEVSGQLGSRAESTIRDFLDE